MRVLILEDDPNRVKAFKMGLIGKEVFVTDDAKVCIEKLKNEQWDTLFLDHDLGGQVFVASGDGTGYEVAVFLEEFPEYKPKDIYVHSLNAGGAKKMLAALKLDPKYYVPFAWDKLG